jgi:hypothetical protein
VCVFRPPLEDGKKGNDRKGNEAEAIEKVQPLLILREPLREKSKN